MDLSSIEKLTWLDHEDGSPIVIIEYGFSFHHHFFLKQMMIAKKLSIEVLGFAPT